MGEQGARVVVAMSGGVDSSVAAALLVEQGYQVVGMMLRLWAEPGGDGAVANRCCTPEAVTLARQVARHVRIPFHLFDVTATFKAEVVDHFVAEYAAGRTPNPCIRCNRFIRFGRLLEHALGLGARYLATGHYARVRAEGGNYQLLRGVDPDKDQSYVLYALDQHQLAHACFPLGELTKREVREMARRWGLPVADRAESQDLCFVADGDYRRFLAHYAPASLHPEPAEGLRPGPIRDTARRTLGQHGGLAFYTVGQRKGLGISAAEPLYVLSLDPTENALVVGTAAQLGRDECVIGDVHYITGQPPLSRPFTATAKIRYGAREAAVTVTPLEERQARVRFTRPQRDITPGQALVLYDGQVVLGGGTIL